jgi:hypothetical protein
MRTHAAQNLATGARGDKRHHVARADNRVEALGDPLSWKI